MLAFLLLLFFVKNFLPFRPACQILVPPTGIEPMSLILEEWSLNHWTTREVPLLVL